MKANIVVGVLVATLTSHASSAQSLADVAKKTADERAKAGKASKVYTNADVPASEAPARATAALPATTDNGPTTATPGVFDGLYKALKGIQAATETGVSYVRFRELLPPAAAEVATVRDHELTAFDRALLSAYSDALEHYEFSAALWRLQINIPSSVRDRGEVPIAYDSDPDDQKIVSAVTRYRIPISDRRIGVGAGYKSIPLDSFKRVWTSAEDAIARGNELYLRK